MTKERRCALGIDIGGGGVRAVAINLATGTSVASSSVAVETQRDADGSRTQSADDWIEASTEAILSVTGQVGGSNVAVVAATSAAHNAAFVDRTVSTTSYGTVQLWSDWRPAATLAGLDQPFLEHVKKRTRVSLDTAWTLTQRLWQLEGSPARVTDMYLGHGVLIHWLTARNATDPSTAAGTAFFDPVEFRWCDELVSAAGLSDDALPQIARPGDIVGHVTRAAAASTGLTSGTPVIAGATDTACELIAAGKSAPMSGLVKIATSGTATMVTDRPLENERALLYPHALDGRWYLVAPTNAASQSIAWASTILGSDVTELAQSAPVGSRGLTFLPHLDGERTPLWTSKASGAFLGLRSHHTRNDMARAVLEGVAFSLSDALTYLEGVAGGAVAPLSLSGGGARNPLLAQIVVAALGRQSCLIAEASPARGAAILAASSLGHDAGDPSHNADAGVEFAINGDLSGARHRYRELQGRLNFGA